MSMRRVTRQWARAVSSRLNITKNHVIKALEPATRTRLAHHRTRHALSNLEKHQLRLNDKILRFQQLMASNLTPSLEYADSRNNGYQERRTDSMDSVNQGRNYNESMRGTLQEKRRKLLEEIFSQKLSFQQKSSNINERRRVLIQDLRDTKNLMKKRLEKAVEKENIYTIPNLLCITRIAFSPYLGYLIVMGNFHHALGLMVIASASDWLDGWIARTYPSQSSTFGSFLDPLADKVLIGTLFVTLTYVDLIPVALTGLILARDLVLVGAGFVIRYKSLPPPRTLATYFDATHSTAQLAPTMISKVNTGVQLILVASTLAAPVFGYVGHPALNALCYVTATTTVLAALSYITMKDTYKYIGRK